MSLNEFTSLINRSSAKRTAFFQFNISENGKIQPLLKITGMHPTFNASKNLNDKIILSINSL